MRSSKRTQILEAAAEILESEGSAAITYEAVAARSGLTKGGLLYHFPSREALMAAVHHHLADRWEQTLRNAAGSRDAEQLDADERLAAYVTATAHAATRGELMLMLEAGDDPALGEPWKAVLQRWTPPEDADHADDASIRAIILRLAADGLWMHDAIGGQTMPPHIRAHIIQRLMNAAISIPQ